MFVLPQTWNVDKIGVMVAPPSKKFWDGGSTDDDGARSAADVPK